MAYPTDRHLTRVSEPYRNKTEAANTGLRYHGGTDIATNDAGKKVLAAGGRINLYAVGAGVIEAVNIGERRRAGNNVYLRLDGDGSRWWYNHNLANLVRAGQRVDDGERIAFMGATGDTTGIHSHIERHWPHMDAETDPWPYIKDEPDARGKTNNKIEGAFMALSENEQEDLYRIVKELWRIHIVPGTPFPYDAVILNEARAQRGAGPLDADDVSDIAKDIADSLSDDLARQVADELHARLKA